jgi:hypothetical protein
MEMDTAKKPDSTAAAKPKQVVVLLGGAEPDPLVFAAAMRRPMCFGRGRV